MGRRRQLDLFAPPAPAPKAPKPRRAGRASTAKPRSRRAGSRRAAPIAVPELQRFPRRSPTCQCGCGEKLGEERITVHSAEPGHLVGEFKLEHWPVRRPNLLPNPAVALRAA